MNDTPETDAQGYGDGRHPWVATDFARKLERERDDLQKAVNNLCDHFGVSPANTTLLAVEVLKIKRERDEAITRRLETIMQCELYEQERDEARAERDILRLDAQREAEHHDRMVGELEKVYKERDEARELLAKALVRGDLALAETKKAKEELFWSDYQDKREMQRERDEARHKLELCMAANSDVARIAKERDEERERNAKLSDIAKKAINYLGMKYRSWGFDEEATELRAELDQLKEGAK
jgi:hypothetical protein